MAKTKTRVPADKPDESLRLISATRGAGSPLSGSHWQELHTFLAVARLGSFNKAATSLGLTHSTVSRHIRRLHDVYGVPLIVASKQGTFLTERGERMVTAISQVDRALFDMNEEVRSETSRPSGTVRLSISDGLGLIFVLPELKALSAKYPEVSIYLQRPNVFRHLREDKADIMVGFFPPQGDDLTSAHLGYFHFMTFAAPDYLRAVEKRGGKLRHSFVDSERFRGADNRWEPWRTFTATGRTVHWCDPSLSYSVMVKAGLGIGLLPSYNLLEPSFQHVDSGIDIRVPLHLVTLTERLTARHVRIVYDLILRIFQDNAVWFAPDLPTSLEGHQRPRGYDLISH